jgi:iron-sulfur cluster assembly accessory protein
MDTGTAMELTLPPKVTDRAFARLAEIAAAMGEVKPLRVAVDGGGCSGFQYSITLDEAAADDLVLEKDGQRVLVDQVSLPFLANAVIDFTDERQDQLRLRHQFLDLTPWPCWRSALALSATDGEGHSCVC